MTPWALFSLIFSLFGGCFTITNAATPPPKPDPIFTMKEALQRARENSDFLKAKEKSYEAAQHKSDALGSKYFPKLSLEAQFRYIEKVPKIQLGPSSISFGDNNNYSLGPVLSFVLWDGGARSNIYNSATKLAEARKFEVAGANLKIELETALAYVQAQLFQKVLELSRQSSDLSRKQFNDISHRRASGSATKIDALSAKMEWANFELRVAQNLGSFQSALVRLSTLTGPISKISQDSLIDDYESIQLDDLIHSSDVIAKESVPSLSTTHPLIEAQKRISLSLESASEAQQSSVWPQVQVQAKTTMDYPNGPILEQINQNTVLLNFNWTLWDWNSSSHEVSEKRALAIASKFQATQEETELNRDYKQAVITLTSLRQQRERANEISIQTERLAELNYDAYKAGGLAFLQVQSANLRLLEARIHRVQIEAQFLSQYYQLQFYSGKRELQ